MSDDEMALSMTVPLDGDGFLRRECPTCEREFKWLPSSGVDDPEVTPPPEGGYFCPYCAVQAPEGQWLTKAQVELAQNMVATQLLGPMLDDFSRDLQRIGRRPGGLLSISSTFDAPDEMEPLTESDDMKRVNFVCHPGEPVKVLDAWDRAVYCLVCGNAA